MVGYTSDPAFIAFAKADYSAKTAEYGSHQGPISLVDKLRSDYALLGLSNTRQSLGQNVYRSGPIQHDPIRQHRPLSRQNYGSIDLGALELPQSYLN